MVHNFFLRAPSVLHRFLQPLFKNVDMDKQGAKLMKILGVAVLQLDKFEAFKPMLAKLGKKVGVD